MSVAAYKLGSWPGHNSPNLPVEPDHEHRYGHRFEVEQTTGPDRIKIGADNHRVKLLIALTECLAPPLYMLYVLHVPRSGSEAARYESPLLDQEKLAEFIWTFSEFFQRDARHDLWVGSIDGTGLLVLDSHGLLYAYGPQDRYTAVLRSHGLENGAVTIPSPHVHHYHMRFDVDEVELLRAFAWEKSPLMSGDRE